ncbi:metallophosphoesterase [Psittacicella hinzii]|uniref:Calcineurin-like phosphoesterase domain-containing protein n=1 Tax=Psittacicella hinzii TaxID=2028575 RepID=A0A3A1YNT0_9GAMM|nr:metallophosphoesterase [Psittacicella hinzii]RIY38888.1 hypothetical protein CKF58_03190 [Psittacicella hinzii]
MSKYLIGDIHGCANEFERLLSAIDFNPSKDELYLAGDLVCRGNASVRVIDLAIKHQAQVVLGNNDLRLICLIHGGLPVLERDQVADVMSLDPRKQRYYADYLVSLPLVIAEDEFYLTHASLEPHWSHEQIVTYAKQSQEFIASLSHKQRGYLLGFKYFHHMLQDLSLAQLERRAPQVDFTRMPLVPSTYASLYGVNPQDKQLTTPWLTGSWETDAEFRQFAEMMMVFTVARYKQIRLPQQAGILYPHTSHQAAQFADLQNVQANLGSVLVRDPLQPYADFNLEIRNTSVIDYQQFTYPWFAFKQMHAYLSQHHTEFISHNPNLTLTGFDRPVYFGHWHIGTCVSLPAGIIGTDSSCVEGGYLSAYALPESKVDMQDTNTLLSLAQPIAKVKRLVV